MGVGNGAWGRRMMVMIMMMMSGDSDSHLQSADVSIVLLVKGPWEWNVT
jgi:hypothetical protein